MNQRVKEIRKALNLTLDKFSEPLGVWKTTISRIENGSNNVTEQMVRSICREYHVNEQWLRTGEGEMFVTYSDEEAIAAFTGHVISCGSQFQKDLLLVLSRLSTDEWKVIEKIISGMTEKKNEKKEP